MLAARTVPKYLYCFGKCLRTHCEQETSARHVKPTTTGGKYVRSGGKHALRLGAMLSITGFFP